MLVQGFKSKSLAGAREVLQNDCKVSPSRTTEANILRRDLKTAC